MTNFSRLVLLSASFTETLKLVYKKYSSEIAKFLLDMHKVNEVKIYSEDVDVQSNIDEAVTIYLDSKISDECRQLTLKESDFEITYLPKGKEPEYTVYNQWAAKNRQSGKPTRIIKKMIISRKFSTKEYEDFNNQLKEIVMFKDYTFSEVKGEAIAEWYNYENYYECKGTLGNSCMRDANPLLFNIYMYEPFCSMLIATKEDKLVGRAIVWDIPNVGKIMDRVYYCDDALFNSFIHYAKSNNWGIRINNSALCDGDEIFFKRDDIELKNLTLKLTKQYQYYPYLDSFRYFDPKTSTINTAYVNEDCGFMSDTDGEIIYRESCGCCHTRVNDDESFHSDYENCTLCEDCARYSELMGDYISSTYAIEIVSSDYGDREYIHINDTQYYINNETICKINNIYYRTYLDTITSIDGIYYHTDDENIICIDDEYYLKSSLIKIDDEYYFEDDENIELVDGIYKLKENSVLKNDIKKNCIKKTKTSNCDVIWDNKIEELPLTSAINNSGITQAWASSGFFRAAPNYDCVNLYTQALSGFNTGTTLDGISGCNIINTQNNDN